MKGICISLVILIAFGAAAQQEKVQSGTPALLEAKSGGELRVFLQSLDGDMLTFQAYKATRNMTVDISKVKKLTFYPKYEVEAAEKLLNSGDYAAAVADLAPVMKPYAGYMTIDNNLRDPYIMLMESYRKNNNFAEAREMAEVLVKTGVPELVERGKVNIALVAIAVNDLETAKAIKEELTSEAASLYLQASIERAEDRPKDAIRTVSGIIINHANDLDWLGPSELLCAYLYMDMLGTNSVITTNSPMQTARQVKNIYSGTSVAADAKVLWAQLGGEALDAKIKAEKEEEARIEAERVAAYREAQAKLKAQKEAAKAEKKAAKAAAEPTTDADPAAAVTNETEAAAGTNLTAATEMESE